jgi:hypothetical protein
MSHEVFPVEAVEGCERLRLPHFQTFGSQMATRLSALRTGHMSHGTVNSHLPNMEHKILAPELT